MTDNKEFVKELEGRTKQHQILTSRIIDAYHKQTELSNKKHVLISTLNRKVMGTGTSSLRRTSILTRTAKRNVRLANNATGYPYTVEKDVDTTLTFNHEGMGTINKIRDSDDYTSGSIQSSPLGSDEFQEILFDQDMRNKIKTDLIQQNANKLLRTFCNLETIEPELRIICKASNLIKELEKEIKIDLIYIPDVYDRKLCMKPMKLEKIRISSPTGIHFDGKWKESIELTDPEQDSTYLDTSSIECSLVFMQITDQITAMLDSIEKELNEAGEVIRVQENSINEKLAVYMVMDELSEMKK
jgi:hypothetical protein